ncbi:MAG: type II secretion system protein [Candidatus Moranbacteria bacterium]|nr:type II secretion system protein [Candidatus Moranbacteria bacterium]
MEHITKNKKGFTLVEIMVAIAIVGILAAVVLVSTKSYGVKARSTKATAQLSSALPSMISCIGNMGVAKVSNPSGGVNICTGVASYGNWPSIDNYSYTSTAANISGTTSWFVTLDSTSAKDDVRICCNSAMSSCKIISPLSGATCTATSPIE